MKSIFVPINLRSDYENLVAYAASFSEKSDAHITLYFARRSWFGFSNKVLEYNSGGEKESFLKGVKNLVRRDRIANIFDKLDASGVNYRFVMAPASSMNGIIRQANAGQYDLMLMGTHTSPGLRGRVKGAFASRIVSMVNMPVIVIPAKSSAFDLQHITYAIDLTDYDPSVVRQVKEIAALFDAKLTIAHVNASEAASNPQHATVLEQVISATLDYPKVYYKFFDSSDILRGIKGFVEQHNTNMLAMMSRKRFTWRGAFSDSSLTRRMSRETNVPLLAFRREVKK